MNENHLTNREKEVVKILITGKMLKEIAALLNIKESTLNTHMSHIHIKTRTRSIAELILWAQKNSEEL